MATANKHKPIFAGQRNEPHREKEHVNISDTAKFQSSVLNAGEIGRHLKKQKIRDNVW